MKSQAQHLTLSEAADKGMTLSQWCEHEAKQDSIRAHESEAQFIKVALILGFMAAACVMAAIWISASQGYVGL